MQVKCLEFMNIRRPERIKSVIFSSNVTFYIRLTKFGLNSIDIQWQHFVTRDEEPVVREAYISYTYFAQETDKHMVAA